MRPGRLKALFSWHKFSRLKQDFRTPFRALWAVSGISNKKIQLRTSSGETMEVDRGDLPAWRAYFGSPHCEVRIEQGMFHVLPTNPAHADYFIKGTHGGFTWQPQRWSDSHAPLLQELGAAEKSIYSQHGEDGVIQMLLEKLPPRHRFVVEFGAHDGQSMSNSRHLIVDHDWHAVLIEPHPPFFKLLQARYANDDRVRTVQAYISPENINQLFSDAGVPKDFDILSIDVDGPDYYLWQALTDYQPMIVLVECNASIPPNREYVVPQDKAWELSGTAEEGANLLALYQLGVRKGYRLVYMELSGANLFFVHESIAINLDLSGLTPEVLYQTPQFGELAGGIAPNGRGYALNQSGEQAQRIG